MVQSHVTATATVEPTLLTGHQGSARHIRHKHTSLKKTACPNTSAPAARATPYRYCPAPLSAGTEPGCPDRTCDGCLPQLSKPLPRHKTRTLLRPELRPVSGPAEQAGSELHNKACWRPMPAPHITKKASRYRVSTQLTMARRRQYTGHGHSVQQGSSGQTTALNEPFLWQAAASPNTGAAAPANGLPLK